MHIVWVLEAQYESYIVPRMISMSDSSLSSEVGIDRTDTPDVAGALNIGCPPVPPALWFAASRAIPPRSDIEVVNVEVSTLMS